jgi:hypothetical protein
MKFRYFVKNLFFGSAKRLLEGLICQDVLMIEQEQQAFLNNATGRTVEVNPTVSKVQKLIHQQAAIADRAHS